MNNKKIIGKIKKSGNFKMPKVETTINAAGEKIEALVIDTPENLVWYGILVEEKGEMVKNVLYRENYICRCGAVGCKYFNQHLHR